MQGELSSRIEVTDLINNSWFFHASSLPVLFYWWLHFISRLLSACVHCGGQIIVYSITHPLSCTPPHVIISCSPPIQPRSCSLNNPLSCTELPDATTYSHIASSLHPHIPSRTQPQARNTKRKIIYFIVFVADECPLITSDGIMCALCGAIVILSKCWVVWFYPYWVNIWIEFNASGCVEWHYSSIMATNQ